MSCVALIPVRGGSKRIARKNLKAFDGVPMLARSIDKALSCGLFRQVVVSTDDHEIAELALACGAEGKNLFEIPASVFQIGVLERVSAHECRWIDEDAQPSLLEFACFRTRHSDQPPKSERFSPAYRQPNHPV